MPPSPDPLADIAAAIQILAQSGDAAGKRVAEALQAWLRSRTATLEEALGHAPGIRAEAHQRERNAAFWRLAQRYPGKSGRALSLTVHALACRYETTRWPRDRDARHRPDGALGDCYDILTFGGLPGVEHLRKVVLVGCQGTFNPPRIGADNPPTLNRGF
jgi:hypothetical protein